MSSGEWVEWKTWREDEAKAPIRKGPHQFTKRMKRLPWPYCARCGLMLLKNDATARAARQQCEVRE